MPKWLARGIWWALLLAALTVLSYRLGYRVYDDYCCPTCKGQWENKEVCSWWCRFLADPSAVWTAAGVFGLIAGFWFISTQIQQGHKSLKLTKRTVDTFVDAERGRLTIRDCSIGPSEIFDDEEGPTGKFTTSAFYKFENVGRTHVVVTQVRAEAIAWNVTAPGHPEILLPNPIAEPAPADHRRFTYVGENGPFVGWPIEIERPPELSHYNECVVQVCIRYDTAFGPYIMRICCVVDMQEEGGPFWVHNEKAYTDDQPERKSKRKG